MQRLDAPVDFPLCRAAVGTQARRRVGMRVIFGMGSPAHFTHPSLRA